MTSRDFCYWLQGFFEISDATSITPEQTHMIKKHLNLVFKHEIDPSMGDASHQAELNKIHDGAKPVISHGSYKFPTTEEEAILRWGPKPSPEHVFNIHGWYHPDEGQPRC